MKTLYRRPRQSLTASAIPAVPPVEWYMNPNLSTITPITITDDGKIFGHLAPWGTCHTGFRDSCVTAPKSAADYAYFTIGSTAVECADCDTNKISEIATGVITLGTLHAGQKLSGGAALSHYENTGTAVADVKAGEDTFGIWIAGALRPTVDENQIRELRGAALSGDWRRINGNLELVAALAVNTPGFPVIRASAYVAEDGSQLSLVAAGSLVVTKTPEITSMFGKLLSAIGSLITKPKDEPMSLIKKIQMAYSPDQERDESGRWSSDGGGMKDEVRDAEIWSPGGDDPRPNSAPDMTPPIDRLNLEGKDLRDVDLSKNDLSGANLRGVNLEGKFLAGKDLSGADLRDADLSGAILRDASLTGANLNGANLSGAELVRANLFDTDLRSANLTGADMKGALMLDTDLRNADLSNANLYGANLAGANLIGKDLTGAKLRGVDLSGANLRGAHLEGADLNVANLKGANLEYANLEGAKLYRANLKGAYLNVADLTGANLKGADLTGANLKGASMPDGQTYNSKIHDRSNLSLIKKIQMAYSPDQERDAEMRGANVKGAITTGADLGDNVMPRGDGRDFSLISKIQMAYKPNQD